MPVKLNSDRNKQRQQNPTQRPARRPPNSSTPERAGMSIDPIPKDELSAIAQQIGGTPVPDGQTWLEHIVRTIETRLGYHAEPLEFDY